MICRGCNTKFTAEPGSLHPKRKYCTDECKQAHCHRRKTKRAVLCKVCNQPVETVSSHILCERCRAERRKESTEAYRKRKENGNNGNKRYVVKKDPSEYPLEIGLEMTATELEIGRKIGSLVPGTVLFDRKTNQIITI